MNHAETFVWIFFKPFWLPSVSDETATVILLIYFFFKKKKKVKANTELSQMKNSIKNESIKNDCYRGIDSWFWEESMLQPSAVQRVLQNWRETVIVETQETLMLVWWQKGMMWWERFIDEWDESKSKSM